MNFRSSLGGGTRRATVIDMTALIDVVFQLLIFFLLTSSYVSQEGANASQVPVELPESSLAAQAVEVEAFTVAIDEQGRIFADDGAEVTVEELGVRLLRVAEKKPNTVVLIRADQAVAYGRVAQVMAAARAPGLRISAVLRTGM